jgi:hypothetical protein
MSDLLFDLRQQSSTNLDRLEIGINSGIVEAHKLKLTELEETLIAFRVTVQLARKIAIVRESEQWAADVIQEILKPS